MIRNFHKTCVGLLCAISASFVAANDCCYEYSDTDYGTFGVKGEYLFWTAELPCMDFAQQVVFPVTTDTEGNQILGNPISQTAHHLGNKWRSGFRVGADYQCSLEDPWRYSATYTYYRTSDCISRKPDEVVEGQIAFLSPIIPFSPGFIPFFAPVNQPYITGITVEDDFHSLFRAKSDHFLRLDYGDVEIIRTNALCGPANFNVLVGVRGGYIRDHWDNFFDFINEEVSIEEPFLTDVRVRSKNHWSYLSIGPRVGGQFDWCLGYGFSLYVDASLTGLWGKVKNRACSKVRASFTDPLVSPDPVAVEFNLENICRHRYKIVPLLQGEFGLAWFMTCESWVIQAKIGVEGMHWVNLAENFHYPISFGAKLGSIRSLDLYGLTLGLGFMF